MFINRICMAELPAASYYQQPIGGGMNRLFKLLGYRGREYRGVDFVVRIEPIHREAVSVTHTRDGASLNMEGERIGKRWGGIEVHIPQEVEPARVPQIAGDLETAFLALGYGYVISRSLGVESVSENEREAAISELRQMGYEAEVSADRKQIRPKRIPGAPRQDMEALRQQAPRMMWLIQSLHGKRPRFEVLAKSKDF